MSAAPRGGNTIRGDDGANRLQGNGGADELHPQGNPAVAPDILTGGPGADTFVFKPEDREYASRNKITDFADDTDVLDLTAFSFTSFSEVANKVDPIDGGIELELNRRVKEDEILVEDPVPHTETKTRVVTDQIQLMGMTEAAFDAQDVALAHNTRTEIAKLYMAVFGRAPDASGLDFWVSQVTEQGSTLGDVTRSFFISEEGQATYPPSLGTEALVDKVYTNLLARDPDPDGKAYWVEQLTSGAVPREQFVKAVIDGAEAESGSWADAEVIERKTEVAERFAELDFQDPQRATTVLEEVESGEVSPDEVIGELERIAPDPVTDALAAKTGDPVPLNGLDEAFDAGTGAHRLQVDPALGEPVAIEAFGPGDTLAVGSPGNAPDSVAFVTDGPDLILQIQQGDTRTPVTLLGVTDGREAADEAAAEQMLGFDAFALAAE